MDDQPPVVTAVTPPDGAAGIAANAILTVAFDEDVAIDADWFTISCADSAEHAAVTNGGPRAFTLSPVMPFTPGETCTSKLHAAAIHDLDAADPPDTPTADFAWQFTVAKSPPPPDHILINEVDADTPGSDTAEFIELFDGGVGHTDLTGLVVVLWNGQNDTLLRSIALDGYETDADGFFVLGSAGLSADLTIAKGTLQNGPDAVGLYTGPPADFTVGAPLTTGGLIDAIVYGPGDEPDTGLLPLLAAGQQQRDEGERGAAEDHSLQRCPNGAGGPRETAAYRADMPSPGAPNPCLAVDDDPPAVVSTTPSDGAQDVAPAAAITITFSEDVIPDDGWAEVVCSQSGAHEVVVGGGPRAFSLSPEASFAPGERCEVTVWAGRVHDADADDPPNDMTVDYRWAFTVRPGEPPFILINELDADTPGSDTAEFIELYDGGIGRTDLSGLVVVLWNGRDDTAYRIIDLTQQATDENGYFVLGDTPLEPDLPLGGATLQNGPDAVAVYAGRAADFRAGMLLTLQGLRDAVVYGPAAAPDDGLLALLEREQPQIDEASGGEAEAHSLQRCPDGAGGPRRSLAFAASEPTPGRANACATDVPPFVTAIWPTAESAEVPLTATIAITFSEDVQLADGWYAVICATSGDHEATVAGGPRVYHLTPATLFVPDELCTVTLHATAIHDVDGTPPDTMAADYAWRFQLAPALPPPTAGFTSNSPVLIGQTVIFSNTSSGSGALTYQWDFGDASSPSADTNPAHNYAKSGIYIVTLTVHSGPAAATYTAEVEVRPRLVLLPLIAR